MAGPATQPQADSSEVDADIMSGAEVSAVDYLVDSATAAPSLAVFTTRRTFYKSCVPTTVRARNGVAPGLPHICCSCSALAKLCSRSAPCPLLGWGSAVPRQPTHKQSHGCFKGISTDHDPVQVAELYKNCIKLASENKISAKNTWSLPLIDHMSDLVKPSAAERDQTNFQRASCTLETVGQQTSSHKCRFLLWHRVVRSPQPTTRG